MEESLKYILFCSRVKKAKEGSNYDLFFKTLSEEGVRYNMQKHPMFLLGFWQDTEIWWQFSSWLLSICTIWLTFSDSHLTQDQWSWKSHVVVVH